MPSHYNIHGLRRTIPNEIKREIRQNSGFGCVVCGIGIYNYEHVDPEFYQASAHDPKAMTLLCYSCHGKVTTRMLSKDSVKRAMLNSFCKKSGYSNDFFDFGATTPNLKFASMTIIGCNIPIKIKGHSLFEVKAPEEAGAPFRLSGSFYDSREELSLKIIDNEWMANSDNWDVEVVGQAITIR
jgi:hypothetical protein